MPVKLSVLLASVLFSWEAAKYLAEPTARIAAIALLGSLSSQEQEINSDYLSMRELVESAVDKAENDGVHVTYTRYAGAAEIADLIQPGYWIARHQISNILSTHQLDPNYFKYMAEEVLQDQLPDDLAMTIALYGAAFHNFESMAMIPGSGFNLRQSPQEDMTEFRAYIETKVVKNEGKPIDEVDMLYFWIRKNHGDLELALHDNAIAKKALLRNDLNGGFVEPDELKIAANTAFMAEHVRDQSSLLDGYRDLYDVYGPDASNSDLSAFELAGTGYDRAVLTAMLDRFPPSVIAAMAEAQMVSQSDRMGRPKMASVEVSSIGLYNLMDYLNSLAVDEG